MLESEVEKAVCDYATKRGLKVYKFTSPNRRSVPDRLFLHRYVPRCFFIEFKATGQKPTSLQHREITRLLDQGQHVYVCDSIEGGREIIDYEVESSITRISAQSNPVQFAS